MAAGLIRRKTSCAGISSSTPPFLVGHLQKSYDRRRYYAMHTLISPPISHEHFSVWRSVILLHFAFPRSEFTKRQSTTSSSTAHRYDSRAKASLSCSLSAARRSTSFFSSCRWRDARPSRPSFVRRLLSSRSSLQGKRCAKQQSIPMITDVVRSAMPAFTKSKSSSLLSLSRREMRPQ